MAAVVLSTVGGAIGTALPAIGPALGQAIGSAIGGVVDAKLFGPPTTRREGARFNDLSVQVSTYGKMIPIIYGTVRIAGNVIWATPIKETATTTTQRSGGGKGGGGATTSTTNFSYSITLAIAICEGEVDELLRVWADAKQIDLSAGSYRLHSGNETQLPDSAIEAVEGVGSTPAYRGISYVVIEDFPLADFGNRIPNFTFEVRQTVKPNDYDGRSTEEMVKNMTIIPGAGEFVYDTVAQEHLAGELIEGRWILAGYREPVNKHNPHGVTNAVHSLNQLQQTCPNLEWVSIVVSWFADSLDVGTCNIYPAMEFAALGGTTEPDRWSVAGQTRFNARRISFDDEGRPRYGGTPDDASLIRFIDEIKSRGLKVMLLPFLFMDVEGKPWRGRMTGSDEDITSFFTRSNGYNDFIMHYANLLGDKVDAFAIASEMVGITTATESAGVYEGVNQLKALASSVRSVVAPSVKLTYAADWSEYHHADGGWYHLDPLWASDDIDMVGIDAYFPLTDAPQSVLGYDIQQLRDGWTQGEGYDYFYSDAERTNQVALSSAFAWKNIRWWWENEHVNPDGTTTEWTSQRKKIWFTEYGYPSVDGATNQPNVFYAPDSDESFFPRHSNGEEDVRAQRTAITATIAEWENSDMVEELFLWTWDARPYPYYPDLESVWSDGEAWKYGHWVSGKFGLSSLAEIVTDIAERGGLSAEKVDISTLQDLVSGYVHTQPRSARTMIEDLMAGYFFDAVETDGVLRFVPRGSDSIVTIDEAELIPDETHTQGRSLLIKRAQEQDLPAAVEVSFLSRANLYQQRIHEAFRNSASSQQRDTLSLPLVLSDSEARRVGEIALYLQWISRTEYRFMLHGGYAELEPTDIITVNYNGRAHVMRITNMLQDKGRMRIDARADDPSLYQTILYDDNESGADAIQTLARTRSELLDLPALPGDVETDVKMRIAMTGEHEGWTGGVLYRSDDAEENYTRILTVQDVAVIGAVINALPVIPNAAENRFDESSVIELLLIGEEELESVSEQTLWAYGNAAIVGDEMIQFQHAENIGEGRWRLSRLLRGRLGTEWAANNHAAGERFVLIDERLEVLHQEVSQFNAEKYYKAVTIGATLGEVDAENFTYEARALKPYAPVHVNFERNSANNLAFNWARRTRLNGEWRDGVDAALSEREERYEIEFLDVAGEVKHTGSTTQPSFDYDAVQELLDFAGGQAHSARIYQMSELVGRGYAAEIML